MRKVLISMKKGHTSMRTSMTILRSMMILPVDKNQTMRMRTMGPTSRKKLLRVMMMMMILNS